MATKKIKLLDIDSMLKAAGHDVALYFNILGEVQELIHRNPTLNHDYLCEQVLARYKVTDEWFVHMQREHKQHILDSIKGPR